MKYKVGDKVVYGEVTGVITEVANNKNKDVKVQWSDGLHDWTHSAYIVFDYRLLYEQEKALREAAEEVVETVRKMKPYFYREFVTNTDEFEHYKQLKQNNNGTINTSNT